MHDDPTRQWGQDTFLAGRVGSWPSTKGHRPTPLRKNKKEKEDSARSTPQQRLDQRSSAHNRPYKHPFEQIHNTMAPDPIVRIKSEPGRQNYLEIHPERSVHHRFSI